MSFSTKGFKEDLITKHSFKFVLKSDYEEDWKPIPVSEIDNDPLLLFSATNRWEVALLEQCKFDLNRCKAQVGQFELNQWEKHTELTEISSSIIKLISQRFATKPPVLTRAWIKFYEILCTFPLFSSVQDDSIRALFLCEAPGGFINAVNHYIRNQMPINMRLDWLANTLNPYYEQINEGAIVLDDRFIQHAHWWDNWFFASSNTGDLLEQKFEDDLQSHLTATEKELFDLVTGDGAFQCLDQPDKQEEMVFPLILRETLIGMRFLKHNGSLVVKMFTTFLCETISLLYFICNCFSQVIFYKPVASKHGNSEIYLVCLKFDRIRYHQLSPYMVQLKPEEFVLSQQCISDRFIEMICNFANAFAKRQIQSIEMNVSLFGNISPDQIKTISNKKYHLAKEWLKRFRVTGISPAEQLISGHCYRRVVYAQFDPIFQQFQANNCIQQFCLQLLEIINSLFVQRSPVQLITLSNEHNFRVQPKHGQTYSKLNNSKFCCPLILRSYHILNSCITFEPISTVAFNDFRQHLKTIFDSSVSYQLKLYERTTASEWLTTQFDCLSINSVIFCSLQEEEEDTGDEKYSSHKSIHWLDLYNYIPCIAANDFEMCSKMRNQFSSLLENNHLRKGDFVIFRFKILLSRLAVGMLYSLSKAFGKFTIFSCATTIDDNVYPSVFVVLVDYHHHNLPIQCQSLFSHQSDYLWNKHLLEIIPVPNILLDYKFYDAIVNENCIAILTCIQRQLNNNNFPH